MSGTYAAEMAAEARASHRFGGHFRFIGFTDKIKTSFKAVVMATFDDKFVIVKDVHYQSFSFFDNKVITFNLQ